MVDFRQKRFFFFISRVSKWNEVKVCQWGSVSSSVFFLSWTFLAMAFYFNRFLFTVYWFVFYVCLIIILWDFRVVIIREHSFVSSIRLLCTVCSMKTIKQLNGANTLYDNTKKWWRPNEKKWQRRKTISTERNLSQSRKFIRIQLMLPQVYTSLSLSLSLCNILLLKQKSRLFFLYISSS